MNDDFATAMRRSLELTRAGDLGAATQKIQAALNKRGAAPTPQTGRTRYPLGATIKGLNLKFGGMKQSGASIQTPLPSGAQFDRKHFSSADGSREYMLYTPSCPADELRGLVVMLHGCTQSAEDFATGTAMNSFGETHKMLIAYPEQTQAQNANKCWNWFAPEHQNGCRGELGMLADLATEIARENDLPPGHVFAAGLSAGGAMAALLGATRPDVFRAVGVHSGLAPFSAKDVMSAFAAMQGNGANTGKPNTGPTIVFHGDADMTVAPTNADRIVGQISQSTHMDETQNGRGVRRTSGITDEGHPIELWRVQGAGHAWSGGSPAGSYADAAGPDASAEMMRFFNMMMETSQ